MQRSHHGENSSVNFSLDTPNCNLHYSSTLRRNTPMTSQEVNAAIRDSLGLPPKPESVSTVPQEGHICDFPIWSYSKRRSTVTLLKISHTPSNLVVAHWPSEVESTAPLDFLLRHGLWTPFGCPMSCKIRSIISTTCDFTTKSDGICQFLRPWNPR